MYSFVGQDRVEEVVDGDVSNRLLLPLELMLQPLRKRFQYHFMEDRKTNSLEKVCDIFNSRPFLPVLPLLLLFDYVGGRKERRNASFISASSTII